MTNYFEQTPGQLEQFLDFMEADIENVQRVINTVEENNIDAEFIVHAKSETVEESAENTGVDKQKIVKTLIFIAGNRPVAVLCPGDSRVDEDRLEQLTGETVRMARPSEVKQATGYIVGGVSPFDLDIPVYMEESILEHDTVKPAAGSRVVGVEIDPEKLKKLTGAQKGHLI